MISFGFTGETYQTNRIIGDINGDPSGPTVVLVGGIHGNEPSGVIAIQRVLQSIKNRDLQVKGRILGIVGNMAALAERERYLSKDLNRLWDQQFFRKYTSGNRFQDSEIVEYREASEIYGIISPLLMQNAASKQAVSFLHRGTNIPPLYFFDLHTTSSHSAPFIAINDQLDNREFAMQFSVPTVLGIEEFLHGPLLSYVNDFGPVAFTFEAGQHDDVRSVALHEAFIYQALVQAKLLNPSDLPEYADYQNLLIQSATPQLGIYEVVYRHPISSEDQFKMIRRLENFTPIKKGEVIAKDRQGDIRAPSKGLIFMPLYQPVGEDGFFIVRRIPRLALAISSYLRRRNFENLLLKLPGISRSTDDPDALVVDSGIARLLAIQVFHLLGYRRKRIDGHLTTYVRREVGFIPRDRVTQTDSESA